MKTTGIILLYLLIISPHALAAPKTISINDNVNQCIDGHTMYTIDSSWTLGIGEIALGFKSKQFPSLPLNSGYNKNPVWVYIQIHNSPSLNHPQVLTIKNPLLDSVDLFLIEGENISPYGKSGRMVDEKWPALPESRPSFILPKTQSSSYGLLLRIKTSDVCIVSIDIKDFETYTRFMGFIKGLMGIYFGALLVIALLNAFLFFWARYNNCLTYAFYVVSFAFFQFFACGILNVASAQSWMMQSGVPFFAGSAILFGALFTIDFLSLRKDKTIRQVFFYLFVLYAIAGAAIMLCAPLCAGRISAIGASIIGLLLTLTCPVAGVLLKKINGPSTTFFTFAVSATAVGTILNAIRNFGFIPDNLLTAHGNLFGSALGFFILNIALVSRIAESEKEKNDAFNKARMSDTLATESRFQALQAQINPHFLFNTLNALSEYIAIDPEMAEKLVEKLSKLFRYTLTASERKNVLLSEELEIINTYLSIEKQRFGKSLEYAITIEGDPSKVAILGLLIQPIVENSIKYAVSPLPEGGSISILCRVEQERVYVRIHDTGPGFGKSTAKKGTGFGLNNVKERLELSFGKKGILTCTNENGARVEIEFPRKKIS